MRFCVDLHILSHGLQLLTKYVPIYLSVCAHACTHVFLCIVRRWYMKGLIKPFGWDNLRPVILYSYLTNLKSRAVRVLCVHAPSYWWSFSWRSLKSDESSRYCNVVRASVFAAAAHTHTHTRTTEQQGYPSRIIEASLSQQSSTGF